MENTDTWRWTGDCRTPIVMAKHEKITTNVLYVSDNVIMQETVSLKYIVISFECECKYTNISGW